MMVHAWQTVRTSVVLRDNSANGQSVYVDTTKYTASDRWSKHADMTHQLAVCLADKMRAQNVSDVSVFVDVWCSLNGRFQQRIYDPDVDILAAGWSPWKRAEWIKPLLSELSDYREQIRDALQTTNEGEDVLFVADFPGMSVEHYVSNDLSSLELQVIRGTIKYRYEMDVELVEEGNLLKISNVGGIHQVDILGKEPASYLYRYHNRTSGAENPDQKFLKSWSEYVGDIFVKRYVNYCQFLTNIVNCLL